MSSSIPDELRAHLKKQLGFLERSCEDYDDGQLEESIRAATVIRVLIHDTKSSTSLLKMMNGKTIRVISSVGWMPAEYWRPYYLLMAQRNKNFHALVIPKRTSDGGLRMEASLGQREHCMLVSVEDWWNQIIWMECQSAQMLSRKDLVLAAANKDGGAHVDLDSPKNYEAIKKMQQGGFSVYAHPIVEDEFLKHGGLVGISQENSHLAAIRQMGYELLNSSELTDLCDYPQTSGQKIFIWPWLGATEDEIDE